VNLKKAMKNVDTLILVIKAKGGWDYRKQILLSDVELSKWNGTAENDIKDVFIRAIIAEEMLRENPPSIHSRWAEYQNRLKEAKNTLQSMPARKPRLRSESHFSRKPVQSSESPNASKPKKPSESTQPRKPCD